MISLQRLPAIAEPCPACGAGLAAEAWLIPGMRSLARTRCSSCERPFYVDLPVGQAIHSPIVLDPETGMITDRIGVDWFARWLSKSYAERAEASPELRVIRLRAIQRPVVLLNCIDVLYGHALLKLLNAQHYLDSERYDVVVLIQPFLRDLVPEGVAECWSVDLPLQRGTQWSDAMAAQVAREVERIGDVHLAPAHSHPHQSTFAIERFSGMSPFELNTWGIRRPTVTFVWRSDRTWDGSLPGRRIFWSALGRGAGGADRQATAVVAFFEALRRSLPNLDAAVAGIGTPRDMSGWITDLRVEQPDAETDRAWLGRYAGSHLVVGVHGSNMLLPSAHAGGVIELIDESRAGNFLQDILFNGSDPRDLFFRYRFVDMHTRADELAALASRIIRRYPDFDGLMDSERNCDHDVKGPFNVRH